MIFCANGATEMTPTLQMQKVLPSDTATWVPTMHAGRQAAIASGRIEASAS